MIRNERWRKSIHQLHVESLEPRQMLALIVPAYSSRPSAYVKLHLDFDSYAGNFATGIENKVSNTPAYTLDADATSFSTQELNNIERIYQIVAEKYSPFDVDVTTISPGTFDDGRTGKIVIGGDGAWYGGSAGGVAHRGGFWGIQSNVGYVWDGPSDPRYVGETAAHEAGHFFGLKHQSLVNSGVVTQQYRDGMIMGSGQAFADKGGRWNVGATSGKDSFDGSIDADSDPQDDVGKLLSEGLRLRPDDHGNSLPLATTISSSETGFGVNGVIETEVDTDVFSFSAIVGSRFTISVDVPEAAMLNPRMRVINAATGVTVFDNGGNYGESFEIVSATSDTYHVLVSPNDLAGGEYNIGSYHVAMGVYDGDGNSPEYADLIAGVPGFLNDESPAFGRHTRVGFLDSIDQLDWYKIKVRPTRRATISITSIAAGADVDLLVFKKWNSDPLPGRLIGSSTNLGSAAEFLEFDPLGGSSAFYYVAAQWRAGDITSYTLNIELDDNFSVRTIRRRDETVYDHIGTGADVDRFSSGVSPGTGGVITFTLDIELETAAGQARLLYGYDANENLVLDPGEIVSSDVVGPSSIFNLDNVRARNLAGKMLLVEVRAFAGNPTNYRIEFVRDLLPIYDGPFNATPASDIVGSFHGFQVEDLVAKDDDEEDVLRLPQAPHGGVQILIDGPVGGGAKFELIADLDSDGELDVGEILSEGQQMFYQVQDGSNIPYYVRITHDPQGNDVAPYKLIYRDTFLNGQDGSLSNPRILPPEQNSVAGYVAIVDEPLLDLREVFYQLTVEEEGTLQLKLLHEDPQLQQLGLPALAGLRVIRDFNENGTQDLGEHLTGFIDGAADQLQVNVIPGDYLIGVRIPTGEIFEGPVGPYDFTLQYELADVSDTLPVVVTNSQYLKLDSPGFLVEFSEDVGMTITQGDIELQAINGILPAFSPEGITYDPETRKMFVPLNPNLPGGDFRLTIKKHSLADPAGNRIDFFSADFNVSACVTGRRLFFNDSHFDGNDPGINKDDDFAIAYNKQALLPDHVASFENYVGAAAGITGVMVDLANATGEVGSEDFQFLIGNNHDVSTWTELDVLPDSGNRSTPFGQRVTLTWPDGTVNNRWLQIRVLANERTGLSQDDVFYFGNLVGETGNTSFSALTDFADLQRTFGQLSSPANVTNRFDFDKSGIVDFGDLQLLFDNLFESVELIEPVTAQNAFRDRVFADPVELIDVIDDDESRQENGEESDPLKPEIDASLVDFAGLRRKRHAAFV